MREAMLYKKLEALEQKNVVRCSLCSHYCIIKEGDLGFCLCRKNIGGKLCSLNWGKAAGLAIDPIEKKPFFHFKPGAKVASFGTPACNFRCLNCQNWDLSQATREGGAGALDAPDVEPKTIVDACVKNKVDGVAYTYSEPTIFFEYAYDVINECGKMKEAEGLFHAFVSNGYFSKEMLEVVKKEKLLQAIRIDLKFMDDDHYYKITGGRLKPVLESIKRVHESGIHLEVINLVIPGENDDEESFEKVAKFVLSLSPDIPLHFSRFFPYYKMMGKQATSIGRLVRAREIAKRAGLNYVYIGNTDIEGAEDTRCPKCNELLIERSRFGIKKNVFAKLGKKDKKKPKCPKCKENIAIVL